jgi:hypothetical protein
MSARSCGCQRGLQGNRREQKLLMISRLILEMFSLCFCVARRARRGGSSLRRCSLPTARKPRGSKDSLVSFGNSSTAFCGLRSDFTELDSESALSTCSAPCSVKGTRRGLWSALGSRTVEMDNVERDCWQRRLEAK